MMKSFALSPAAAVGKRKSESVVLYCFQRMGVILGIFLLVFITLFLDKMHKNYATDKPVTGFLIFMCLIQKS